MCTHAYIFTERAPRDACAEKAARLPRHGSDGEQRHQAALFGLSGIAFGIRLFASCGSSDCVTHLEKRFRPPPLKGFAFAAAFTAYDGDPEPILEPEYGEIVFNHFSWGPQDDGTYATSLDKIEPHVCTDEELNLDGKSTNPLFLPVIE